MNECAQIVRNAKISPRNFRNIDSNRQNMERGRYTILNYAEKSCARKNILKMWELQFT